MTTLFYTHETSLAHEMGPGHPERPDRLRAIQRALEGEEFALLHRVDAPRATPEMVEIAHPAWYVDRILNGAPKQGYTYLDPDTSMCPATPEAALHSAGGAIDAVRQVMEGKARNAFCALRPPGHHAEPDQAMGFCFFANAALGALVAHREYQAARVAAVDFDVHHGNGTQAFAEAHDFFFYASSHQSPCYPGTGREHDRGKYDNIRNVELAPGAGGEEFQKRWEADILPALRAWNPDLIVISAGFDAHARDPLAFLRLEDEDYGWVSRKLTEVADECCDGRIVSVLEGGYDLVALAGGVQQHVRALMGS